MKQYIYFLLLAVTSAFFIYNRKLLSRPDRYLALLIWTTLISEVIALFVAYKWRNNFPVYHVFNPIQLVLWSLYFGDSVRVLKRHSLGLTIGFVGVFFSVLNTLLLQHTNESNSYFLLYEGTVVTVYCLLAMREILLAEHVSPLKSVQFWVTTCSLLFWSSTYTGWGLYEFLGSDKVVFLFFVSILTTANYLLYFGIAGSILFYRRLTPTPSV